MNKNRQDYSIISTMILIVLIFWILVLITLYNNAPAPTYFLPCDPGECATNIYNGEKRCLDDITTSIVYDPTYEVCNKKTSCNNPMTKYAVQEDGSTNSDGICPDGITCKCIKKPRCSTSILATFSPRDAVIIQQSDTVQGSLPEIGETDYCYLRPYYLNKLVPRTKECNFTSTPVKQTEMLQCIRSNPCTIGVMVVKPHSILNYVFNKGNGLYNEDEPVMCVAENKWLGSDKKMHSSIEKCDDRQILVWDSTQDRAVCKY
jgi:hypothetical protein